MKATFTCFILVTCSLYLWSKLSAGISYDEVYDRDDWRYIEINDELVVLPTIVDREIVSTFMIGLRYPAEEYQCENESLIMIRNEKKYFILDLVSGKNLNFSSLKEFRYALKNLGLSNEFEALELTKFESVWSHYSNYYDSFSIYSTCK